MPNLPVSAITLITSSQRFPTSFMETLAGLPITSFRLASTQRRFDRSQERWVDGEANNEIAHCLVRRLDP